MRLIDKDALLSDIERAIDESGCVNHEGEIMDCVRYAPTIDHVNRGEWKRGKEFISYPRVPFISDAYYCSKCENEAYWDTDYGQQLFKYCPNCGAKMDE